MAVGRNNSAADGTGIGAGKLGSKARSVRKCSGNLDPAAGDPTTASWRVAIYDINVCDLADGVRRRRVRRGSRVRWPIGRVVEADGQILERSKFVASLTLKYSNVASDPIA